MTCKWWAPQGGGNERTNEGWTGGQCLKNIEEELTTRGA